MIVSRLSLSLSLRASVPDSTIVLFVSFFSCFSFLQFMRPSIAEEVQSQFAFD